MVQMNKAPITPTVTPTPIAIFSDSAMPLLVAVLVALEVVEVVAKDVEEAVGEVIGVLMDEEEEEEDEEEGEEADDEEDEEEDMLEVALVGVDVVEVDVDTLEEVLDELNFVEVDVGRAVDPDLTSDMEVVSDFAVVLAVAEVDFLDSVDVDVWSSELLSESLSSSSWSFPSRISRRSRVSRSTADNNTSACRTMTFTIESSRDTIAGDLASFVREESAPS
ncbi:hypothetical protein B7494_g4169 [Chlorociboria aeruginascens]|nr:hypothetical protein B7494_g4169 [Chlorociboria aeruginascens]